MPRKIVIVPSFASSHFLKCWILNVIDVLNPDIIIINEGLFPQGPENKGHVNAKEFREKYCHSDVDYIGFDWDESTEIAKNYPGVFLLKLKHTKTDVNIAFMDCITNGLDSLLIKPGDIIFPIEPDAFHHEKDIDAINWHLDRLNPGEGLKTRWVDFLETQYFTEAINIVQPKYRRFAYCFDNMKNYKSAMDGFMSQNYPKLKQIDDFITFHYPWFVYDKWKELRFDLIYRSDPQYWKDFETGLQEIRLMSIKYKILERHGSILDNESAIHYKNKWTDKILIRPSRSDEGRWAKFIDIEHPKHIHSHPNFVK